MVTSPASISGTAAQVTGKRETSGAFRVDRTVRAAVGSVRTMLGLLPDDVGRLRHSVRSRASRPTARGSCSPCNGSTWSTTATAERSGSRRRRIGPPSRCRPRARTRCRRVGRPTARTLAYSSASARRRRRGRREIHVVACRTAATDPRRVQLPVGADASSSGHPTASASRSSAILTPSATASPARCARRRTCRRGASSACSRGSTRVGWISDRPSRVFVVPADGLRRAPITPAATSRPAGVAWSPDGRRARVRVPGRHDAWDLDWAVDLYRRRRRSPNPRRCTGSPRPADSTRPVVVARRILARRASAPLLGARRAVARRGSSCSERRRAATQRRSPRRSTGTALRTGIAPALARTTTLLFLVETGAACTSGAPTRRHAATCEPVIDGDRHDHRLRRRRDVDRVRRHRSPTSLPEVFVRGRRQRARTAHRLHRVSSPRGDRTHRGRRAVHRDARRRRRGRLLDHRARARPGTRYRAPQHPRRAVLALRRPLLRRVPVRGRRRLRCAVLQPAGSSGYTEAWGRAIRWPECNDPGSGWGGVDYDDVIACVDEALRHTTGSTPTASG